MRLIHVWCDYTGRKAPDLARHQVAAKSWCKAKEQGTWITCAVNQSDLARNTRKTMADLKPLPYIKDIFNYAIKESRAMPDDLLVFTNDDVCMAEGIAGQLNGIGWGSRKDFKKVPDVFTEETIAAGRFHPGADLFFFPAEAWLTLETRFPDMIYACQAWDLVMRCLLRAMNGTEVVNQIAHQDHEQWWLANKYSPSNRYNRRCAERFFKSKKLPLA